MKSQQGQVLLIVVMLLATVLAVTFSISFTSKTETQTAKLEEDSKRALAAAESLLEASLNAGTTVNASSLPNLSGFTGSASVSETQGDTFVTPLLQKDEQYTFYLSSYPSLTPSATSFNFDLYFNSETDCSANPSDGAAIELTFIDSTNNLTKSLIDPCDHITKNAGTDIDTMSGGTLKGVSFGKKSSTFSAVTNKKLVIIRVLGASTKIGIKEVSVPNNSFPSQGKTTTAQATSSTSVTSTVTLFQSYPQIPSEFFVTSF